MKNNIDRYTDEYDLLKVPDDVIIQELRKEIKKLNIIIGQNRSYIDELESGNIKEVVKEVEICDKCSKNIIELKALRSLRTVENIKLNDYVRYKDLFYKEVEENKRLNKLLLQGLKNSIK